MTLIIAIDRPRIHVRAFRDQQAHHLGMPARRRPHQGGLAAPPLFGIDGRAILQQDLRGFDVPGSRHGEERGLALRIR